MDKNVESETPESDILLRVFTENIIKRDFKKEAKKQVFAILSQYIVKNKITLQEYELISKRSVREITKNYLIQHEDITKTVKNNVTKELAKRASNTRISIFSLACDRDQTE